MELSKADQIAGDLVKIIKPACRRIEIAGSVRRRKPEVKDIEIVAAPDPHIDLFGKPDWNAAFPLLGLIPNNLELLKGGQKYRQYRLPQGINIDLFLVTPPAQWGVIYLQRTGPDSFSKWMVTQRAKGGALPSNCVVRDGAIWRRSGYLLETPEEEDWFELCGMDYIEPAERRPMWRR